MVEQTVGAPYHGIVLDNKNEPNVDTCNSLGESPGNYAVKKYPFKMYYTPKLKNRNNKLLE